jgi:hypothetical protein
MLAGSLMVGGTGQFLNDLILFIDFLLLFLQLHGFTFFLRLFILCLVGLHLELHFL